MRNAPSVSYPVGRSFLRTLLHGGALASVWLVCGAWVMLAQADEQGRWALVLVCLLTTAALALALLRPARGRLRWDGQDWFWSDTTQVVAEDLRGWVRVRLDWQSGMLLEFTPLAQELQQSADGAPPRRWSFLSGRSRWLWVEQGQAPMYWNAMRRAAWADVGRRSRASA
jgi:hypothetical protein